MPRDTHSLIMTLARKAVAGNGDMQRELMKDFDGSPLLQAVAGIVGAAWPVREDAFVYLDARVRRLDDGQFEVLTLALTDSLVYLSSKSSHADVRVDVYPLRVSSLNLYAMQYQPDNGGYSPSYVDQMRFRVNFENVQDVEIPLHDKPENERYQMVEDLIPTLRAAMV